MKSNLTSFGQQFVLVDPKSVKASYEPENWVRELHNFCAVEEPLKALQKAQKRLCAMQKAARA